VKYLVTGGAGFLGSHLVDELVRHGDEILAIDDLSTGHIGHLHEAQLRGQVQLHTMDIRDQDLRLIAQRFAPQVVVHLAAQASVAASVEDPIRDADINVLGTINVLEAAKRSGAQRVVYSSSGGAIHGAGSKLPTKETHVARPEAPYGVSKLASMEYLPLYKRAHGLDYVTLLLSNLYGPRQSATTEGGVVAIFIKTLLAGGTPTVHGDGSHTRDLVYVEDAVQAFILAAHKGGGRSLHVSSGRETSVSDLYAAARKVVGGSARPMYGPARNGDIVRSVLDPSAAFRHLGWKATTSLPAGLAATAEWFRHNSASLD